MLSLGHCTHVYHLRNFCIAQLYIANLLAQRFLIVHSILFFILFYLFYHFDLYTAACVNLNFSQGGSIQIYFIISFKKRFKRNVDVSSPKNYCTFLYIDESFNLICCVLIGLMENNNNLINLIILMGKFQIHKCKFTIRNHALLHLAMRSNNTLHTIHKSN